MFFSVINKNLNWEILTKNLVTFKRWDGVKMKNLNIIRVHWKTRFLGGGLLTRKQYIGGKRLKKPGWGGLGQFADLKGGGLDEKEGVVFLKEGGSYPHAYYGL